MDNANDEVKTPDAPADGINYAELKAQLALLDDDMKDWYTTLVTTLNDINGGQNDPGPITSYIPAKNHYQLLSADLKTTLGVQADVVELTLNYKSLGKGISGFLGAAVRAGYRNSVLVTRECKVYTTVAEVSAALDKQDFQRVSNYMVSHSKAYIACKANVASFLVQAAANIIRMTHHWNAQAHKEYTALIKVMGLEDIVPDDQLRPLVYLAVHPCPLPVLERERTKERKHAADLLIETVSKRKNPTPSGFGAAGACYAAVANIRTEEFMSAAYWKTAIATKANEIKLREGAGEPVPTRFIRDKDEATACHAVVTGALAKVTAFEVAMKAVLTNPVDYCVMAHAFGKQRKTLDLTPHKGAMCLLTAYVYARVKGTLAKSPALKKFRNENSVRVTRAIDAMGEFEGTGKLSSILAAV